MQVTVNNSKLRQIYINKHENVSLLNYTLTQQNNAIILLALIIIIIIIIIHEFHRDASLETKLQGRSVEKLL